MTVPTARNSTPTIVATTVAARGKEEESSVGVVVGGASVVFVGIAASAIKSYERGIGVSFSALTFYCSTKNRSATLQL